MNKTEGLISEKNTIDAVFTVNEMYHRRKCVMTGALLGMLGALLLTYAARRISPKPVSLIAEVGFLASATVLLGGAGAKVGRHYSRLVYGDYLNDPDSITTFVQDEKGDTREISVQKIITYDLTKP